MSRITISARHFAIPPVCACCGLASTREVAATLTTEGRRAQTLSLRFPACEQCASHSSRVPPLPSCESAGYPALVTLVSRSGTDTVFEFGSPRYAKAFADANREAKKNVLRVDIGPPLTRPPLEWLSLNGCATVSVLAAVLGLLSIVITSRIGSNHSQPAPLQMAPIVAAPVVAVAIDGGQHHAHAHARPHPGHHPRLDAGSVTDANQEESGTARGITPP